MTGIPPAITEHRLDTYPHIEPKVQKKRSLALDRRKVVTDEVNEWFKAGIVRRVRYPSWVANPVLVKKVDGSGRMCTDFKDLNKACPKDLYPLPEIDWKIESLMGFKYKLLIQIMSKNAMESSDEECSTSGSEDERVCYGGKRTSVRNSLKRRRQEPKAFVGGSWSDSGDEDDEKVKDETCLVAHASSEICLGVDLEPNEWIKDSGCSKHMTGNRKLFSTYKAYNGGNVVLVVIFACNIIGKDETPPPAKTSPLVDDDLDEEEALGKSKRTFRKNVEMKLLKIDEVVNIKDLGKHP
ncbi:hypothetical protein Tco_1235458 [Tanacetum coccineum]